MIKKLFLRKPLQQAIREATPDEQSLKRHLGWMQLMIIGIGAIIGAGIFVLTGKAAAEYAGPAIFISFILASIICIFSGLCYAELASMIPISGGSYSYAYIAMGELPAWTIGWAVTAQSIFSAATVATGWSGYLKSFLHDWGFGADLLTNSYVDIPAMLLVFFIGWMITIGIKAAAHFNALMVFIKLAAILLFILIGIPHIETANWIPFIPENTGEFGAFGFSGIARAAGLVFYAYIGFDTVSALAQDAKNPQRDLPRGILGSLFICTAAYIVVSLVLTGVVSYKLLDVPDPIAVALNAMGPNFFWLATIVKVAILAGLASVILVLLLTQTRIFFAMGQDRLLPPLFSTLHQKSKNPNAGTWVATLATMFFSALFPIEILGQIVSMMTLIIFSIVCLGVLLLRRTHPESPRSFRTPFVPWIPLLGIFCCVGQMLFLPSVTWLQTIVWFLLGSAIYFGYGIRHSKLRG